MVDINTNNMCHSLLFVVGVGHKTLSQYQSISHFFFVKSVFPECGKPPPALFIWGLNTGCISNCFLANVSILLLLVVSLKTVPCKKGTHAKNMLKIGHQC